MWRSLPPQNLPSHATSPECSAIAGCRKRRVRIGPKVPAIFCRRRHQPLPRSMVVGLATSRPSGANHEEVDECAAFCSTKEGAQDRAAKSAWTGIFRRHCAVDCCLARCWTGCPRRSASFAFVVPNMAAAPAERCIKRQRRNARSQADWQHRRCLPRCWSANIAITRRFIGRHKSLRGTASSSIVRRWRRYRLLVA